jgi:hypothetical protein
MRKFYEVEQELMTGKKVMQTREDNSDVCWMYHADMKKGEIVKVELVDDLIKEGWVDSPAKIKKEVKEEVKLKKVK